MGLLSFIVTLPLGERRDLAELIQRQVEQEMHNPVAVRRALEELEEVRAAGEITEEEEHQAQQGLIDRMTGSP